MSRFSPNAEGPIGDWQTSKDKLKDCIQHILHNKTFSDCQFKVQTKSSSAQVFQSHKLILAISSPVFEAMLYGVMAEENKPIVVEDIEPDVFKALLEYIYTDNINLVSSDHYCELYYAARKYMMPYLQKKCMEFIESTLNNNNACKTYEFAKLFEEVSLMKDCLDIIINQTESALNEANLKDVKLSTIITILDLDFLNIQSEITLFNAVRTCANNNNEDKGLKRFNSHVFINCYLIVTLCYCFISLIVSFTYFS
ncbi:hypothetical protein ILUMI_19532 [Ignelater luminosus]|uniref:BTB domain-containing protein n=1 Tax=Ignelater luminosus TaxID=2038154 RepID=A0A8K0CJ44_IGNLU|nr:hypothetical protein ILUMI_19532 [Ignelater luminosus]